MSDSSITEAVLINDPNGLCLSCSDPSMKSQSGLYTSLLKLASQLDPKPKILIETKTHRTYIKEYEEHTVAMRVSTQSAEAVDMDMPTAGEEQLQPMEHQMSNS